MGGDMKLVAYQEAIFTETMKSLEKTGHGAIELFPSGGKSYIGAKIAKRYLDNYTDMNILWFGTLSANNNVNSSVLSKLARNYKDRIYFKHYESISGGFRQLAVEKDTVCLVVMDESHRALAAQCKDFMLDTLSECKCDRLAMSATEKRTDGRHSFRELTPLAIYDEHSISWGADNNIINDIDYSVMLTRISRFDFELFDTYKDLAKNFEDVDDACSEIEVLLSNYSFKFERDVFEAVRQSDMELDGSKGVRHIVFFSTISAAKQHKDQLEKIYSKLYPACKVRVFEYNSKQTQNESKYILDTAVNSEPLPNVVDVIITVNKGTESIHPRGIKSLMLFRGTKSHIVFTQQLGRGVTLKDFCDGKTFVFDFTDGLASLMNGTSIEYGRRTIRDRISNSSNINSLEEISSSLKQVLSSKIKIKSSFATKDLQMLSDKLNKFYSESVAKRNLQIIMRVMQTVNKYCKNELRENSSLDNMEKLYKSIVVTQNIDITPDMNSDGSFTDEVKYWFRIASNSLLNNNINNDSEEYALIQKCGHLFYLEADETGTEDNNWMHDIDYIRKALDKYNGSYEEIAKRASGKRLAEIRFQNIYNNLSVRVCKYARDLGVDISIDNVNFADIRLMTSEEEIEAFKKMRDEFNLSNKIDKNIDQINNETDTEILNLLKAETQELWFELLIKHKIYSIKHNTVYARFLRHKIEVMCRKAFNFNKLSQAESNEGDRLITVLLAYEKGEKLTGLSQEYIFKHAGFKDLSEYCKAIFNVFGIKTRVKYEEIIQATEWYKTFDNSLNGNDEAIVELLRTNVSGLDEYRRKKLNSLQFRDVKRNISEEVTQILVMKQAREFYSPDVKRQDNISEAIKNGVVTSMEIALSPFNVKIADKVQEMIEYTGDTSDWIATHVSDWNTIYRTCTSNVSCCVSILSNIAEVKGIDRKIREKLSSILNKLTKA